MLSTSVAHLLETRLIHLNLIWCRFLVSRLRLWYFTWWMSSSTRLWTLYSRLRSFLFSAILLSRSRSFNHALWYVMLSIKRSITSIFILLLKTFVLNESLLWWESFLSFLCHFLILLRDYTWLKFIHLPKPSLTDLLSMTSKFKTHIKYFTLHVFALTLCRWTIKCKYWCLLSLCYLMFSTPIGLQNPLII